MERDNSIYSLEYLENFGYENSFYPDDEPEIETQTCNLCGCEILHEGYCNKCEFELNSDNIYIYFENHEAVENVTNIVYLPMLHFVLRIELKQDSLLDFIELDIYGFKMSVCHVINVNGKTTITLKFGLQNLLKQLI